MNFIQNNHINIHKSTSRRNIANTLIQHVAQYLRGHNQNLSILVHSRITRKKANITVTKSLTEFPKLLIGQRLERRRVEYSPSPSNRSHRRRFRNQRLPAARRSRNHYRGASQKRQYRLPLKLVDTKIVDGGQFFDVDDIRAELPDFVAELLDSLPLESVVASKHTSVFLGSISRYVVVLVGSNVVVFIFFFFVFFVFFFFLFFVLLGVGECANG
ncbi:hypothetical protein V8G54_014678 [Vigna mungo]|uniref:Uncharacterized protein n=1 Tax=Vigna mungo TaxID=3915 RepID=A0AAQ3NL20_VIGMU